MLFPHLLWYVSTPGYHPSWCPLYPRIIWAREVTQPVVPEAGERDAVQFLQKWNTKVHSFFGWLETSAGRDAMFPMGI